MTHFFAGDGEGSSEKSLTDAISHALISALNEAVDTPAGEHALNITLIVDGYHFDGKKWIVKVSIRVTDYTKEAEDIYHELDAERHHHEEVGEHMLLMFHGTSHNKAHIEEVKHTLHSLQEQLEHSEFARNHTIHDFKIYGDDPLHNQLYEEYTMHYGHPDQHHGAPVLGFGTGGSSDSEDKAA